MCLLSIIIPHHNIPDLLLRCLDSIPKDKGIQIIVVDDNSDENLFNPLLIMERGGTGLELYATKEGRGAGYARNVGLKYVKGKWLLFADSDDFFTEGFYDVVSKYFETEADMVLFKANSVDSETLERSNRSEKMNHRIDLYYEGQLSALDVALGTQVPWCRLINHSFIKKNQIQFDEVKVSNDTMFTTKASCLAGSIEVSSEMIYTVTHRKGSLWDSRKNPSNYLTRLGVQIRRNKYVKQFGIAPSPLLGYVARAWKISPMTFLKALWMVISNGVLFQGFSFYLKSKSN